jgi:uncharacterized protein
VTIYYADSSVLIKRHITEVGSDWVIHLTDASSDNFIVTADITQVEGLSAFNRRVREGAVSNTHYAKIAEDWTIVCEEEYQLVSLSPEVITLSRRLLETYPLRAYDAVQLASARFSDQVFTAAGGSPLIFLSADKRLLDAARGEGLTVDDLNDHP